MHPAVEVVLTDGRLNRIRRERRPGKVVKEKTMRPIGRHWGKGRVLLGLLAGLLVVAGGLAGFSHLDLERHAYDQPRMTKLAALPLLPARGDRTSPGKWPQWRGPNRDGASPETGLGWDWPAGGPPLVWEQLLGRGFSSVVVAQGRLYTMAEETIEENPPAATPPRMEAVVCLDAATGRTLWRFRYPNQFEERFGSGPRSTPAVDGDFVYTVGPTGVFHCLAAATGSLVWRHDLQEEFQGQPFQYGMAASPLVEGELVYTTPGGPDGQAVAAFDKRSGRLVWKALDDLMGYSSPIAVTAAGVRQVLFLTNQALVSFTPQGQLLWRYPWETPGGFNIATPLAFGDYIFLSSGYGKGCVLLEIAAEPDGSLRPHRVYEHNRMRNHFASSVRWGDHLYGFDQLDLVCMNIRTGELAWRQRGLRSLRKGSLLIAEGHLLILGEDGTLTLAEATPAAYRELAAVRVSTNKCWTVPTVAGGRLYIRDEGLLRCFDVQK
jgi:outer membrane protein assembly factor BamB